MVRLKRAVQCSASFGCVVDPFLGYSGFASSIHGICCGGPILASGSGSLSKRLPRSDYRTWYDPVAPGQVQGISSEFYGARRSRKQTRARGKRVRRHKRIESYIGIEHVFCLLACVERPLNPVYFLRLSHNTRLQHGLISTCWANTISPTKNSEMHLEFSP